LIISERGEIYLGVYSNLSASFLLPLSNPDFRRFSFVLTYKCKLQLNTIKIIKKVRGLG